MDEREREKYRPRINEVGPKRPPGRTADVLMTIYALYMGGLIVAAVLIRYFQALLPELFG